MNIFVVSVKSAPAFYSDDPSWDERAVIRLLDLLRLSTKTPKPLRRMLQSWGVPTRRFTYKQSFKLFPSLSKVCIMCHHTY